jgi:hypothetical protein
VKLAETSGGDNAEAPPLDAPIEAHLHALATQPRTPPLSMAICIVRLAEAAPPLRALIARAADGDALSDEEALLTFRGLHVLGAGRDHQTWPALMRLMRLPEEELDALIGFAITETLSRVVAGVFNGDVEGLFGLVRDTAVDEFVRTAAIKAAAFLMWDGRIDRAHMIRFLADFHDDPGAPDEDYAWIAWLEAIGDLGLRELAPRVRQAWREGRIQPKVLNPEDFEADLAKAERAPNDAARMDKAGYGYIEDVTTVIAWADPREDARWRGDAWDDYGPTSEPILNPFRHVGRNDPCPCGSGKKAKRCCMAA